MKKSTKIKPKRISSRQHLIRAQSVFNIPTLVAAMLFLVVVGVLVVRSFAATPTTNPWDCNPPYPTIQHGVADNSGRRTDHCVSAVQWAFVNSQSLRQYIGYPYSNPAIDGRYDPDQNIVDGNDYLWWPIVYLQLRRGQAQTGALTPEQVAFIATYSPFKSPTPVVQPNTAPSPATTSPAPASELEPSVERAGGYDSAPSVFEPLNDVKLEDIAMQDTAGIEDLIDKSALPSSGSSKVVPRVFSGVLRIVPSGDDLASGAVEFRYYLDGRLSKKVTKEPYAFSFDTSRFKDGRHVLTIVAYNGGERLTESSYALTIKNRLNFWQQLYNLLTAPFYTWF